MRLQLKKGADTLQSNYPVGIIAKGYKRAREIKDLARNYHLENRVVITSFCF